MGEPQRYTAILFFNNEKVCRQITTDPKEGLMNLVDQIDEFLENEDTVPNITIGIWMGELYPRQSDQRSGETQ
jgi:hypothetical protein